MGLPPRRSGEARRKARLGGCLKTDETTGNTGNTGIIRTIKNYRGCHQILLINASLNAPCSQCPQWFRVLRLLGCPPSLHCRVAAEGRRFDISATTKHDQSGSNPESARVYGSD